MASTAGQICFLLAAFAVGIRGDSVWWLLPLTLGLAIFGWLTDHYWKIRFYDIYSLGQWSRFWAETLFGTACFVAAAFALGRLLRRILEVGV